MTSENFKITTVCFHSIFRYQTLQEGSLQGVVYENYAFCTATICVILDRVALSYEYIGVQTNSATNSPNYWLVMKVICYCYLLPAHIVLKDFLDNQLTYRPIRRSIRGKENGKLNSVARTAIPTRKRFGVEETASQTATKKPPAAVSWPVNCKSARHRKNKYESLCAQLTQEG